MIANSKVMREADYEALKYELRIVEEVSMMCGGWQLAQHKHRRWEYAMLSKAVTDWYPTVGYMLGRPIRVADHGCGIGLSTALMLTRGFAVKMYEPWVYGDESATVRKMLESLRQHTEINREGWELLNRPLCELIDVDKNAFDIALCVSTLEHIGEYQRAWKDLLSTVREKGLVFITSDFAEDETDHYRHANLRAGRMFTGKTYDELYKIAQDLGFSLLGGCADWLWSEECRMVNDYGFASLAMVRSAQ